MLQAFNDVINDLVVDPVLESLDQAISAIDERKRDIGNFNKHDFRKSDIQLYALANFSSKKAGKYEYEFQ